LYVAPSLLLACELSLMGIPIEFLPCTERYIQQMGNGLIAELPQS
jgi:hypothetical protein